MYSRRGSWKLSTTAAVSSVEPSSTMMSSVARWLCCRTLSIVLPTQSARWYVGRMTLTVASSASCAISVRASGPTCGNEQRFAQSADYYISVNSPSSIIRRWYARITPASNPFCVRDGAPDSGYPPAGPLALVPSASSPGIVSFASYRSGSTDEWIKTYAESVIWNKLIKTPAGGSPGRC
jgi:hypothetical protein